MSGSSGETVEIGATGVAAFPAGGCVAIAEADTRGRKAPASVDERSDGEAALLVLKALGAATDWRMGKAARSVRRGGGAAGVGIGDGGRSMYHFLAWASQSDL